MATTSSFLRVKMSRKLGVSFWPWRRIHPKQLLTLEKNAKMQYRQATNLQKKKKRSQFAYQLKAKQLISTLYGERFEGEDVHLRRDCVSWHERQNDLKKYGRKMGNDDNRRVCARNCTRR